MNTAFYCFDEETIEDFNWKTSQEVIKLNNEISEQLIKEEGILKKKYKYLFSFLKKDKNLTTAST